MKRKRTVIERHDPKDMFCRIPNGRQRCGDCEAVLPLKDFPRNNSSPNGCGPACLQCERSRSLKRKYGHDIEEWKAEQLAKQGGRCAACKSKNPRHVSGKWLVDHDHATGHRRGVICHPCNLALGWRDKGWDMNAANDYFNKNI